MGNRNGVAATLIGFAAAAVVGGGLAGGVSWAVTNATNPDNSEKLQRKLAEVTGSGAGDGSAAGVAGNSAWQDGVAGQDPSGPFFGGVVYGRR